MATFYGSRGGGRGGSRGAHSTPRAPAPYGAGYPGAGYGGAASHDAYASYGYGSAYGDQRGGGYGAMAPGGYGPPGYNQGAPIPSSPLDDEIQMVIGEIQAEIEAFDRAGEGWAEQFKNSRRVLASELEKLKNDIDPEWLEVDIPKPIKVTKKVLVPIYRHPKFNFVGKILGPKGATLQNLAKQHKCHIYVLGRGSTKDQRKEQELLATGDPQFAHYGGPLHVKVETVAPAHVAYQRVTGVLEELSNLLQPVREDTTPAHLKKDENGSGERGAEESADGAEAKAEGGGGPMKSSRGGRGRAGPY